jgi:uncharacterized coiled-coil DUF342 family protein
MMKQSLVCLVLGLVVASVTASATFARTEYRKQFLESYKEAKIAEAAEEAKCFVCHYGKTKKNRNDYGKALSKHLKADAYKEIRKDKEALAKKVAEALEKVEKAKSVSGEEFGKLIKAGKLPGTAPEEDEETSAQ